jgi:hypothetical protein
MGPKYRINVIQQVLGTSFIFRFGRRSERAVVVENKIEIGWTRDLFGSIMVFKGDICGILRNTNTEDMD